MAETTTITVRVSMETKAALDRLAELTKRSRSYLAAEALDGYVRSETEIVEGMLEGLADFEAGRYVTHDAVVARSARLFDEIEGAEMTDRRSRKTASSR